LRSVGQLWDDCYLARVEQLLDFTMHEKAAMGGEKFRAPSSSEDRHTILPAHSRKQLGNLNSLWETPGTIFLLIEAIVLLLLFKFFPFSFDDALVFHGMV
jgi:hypothetical protein